MICQPCKAAADYFTNMMKAFRDGVIPEVAVTPRVGDTKEMHKGCKGGTWCDCQHKVVFKSEPQPVQN